MNPRRHFSPEQKVAAIRRHLLEQVPVSQICNELGIAPSHFYLWQKEFFDNGHLAFERSNGRQAKKAVSVRRSSDFYGLAGAVAACWALAQTSGSRFGNSPSRHAGKRVSTSFRYSHGLRPCRWQLAMKLVNTAAV
ncbi:MAG TPA: transposase [Gemmataceae bacterium]|nr:transposase [Gemmataceae bacterium]